MLWVDGVGAQKMCTLPAVTLGKEEADGELWFVGGEHTFGMIDWEPVDVGEAYSPPQQAVLQSRPRSGRPLHFAVAADHHNISSYGCCASLKT